MANNNIQYTISLKDINAASTLGGLEGSANRFEGSLGNIKTSSLLAAGAIAAIGIAVKKVIDIGKGIFDVSAKFESLNNVINYTSLDAVDAAGNHKFLSHIINDYKLPIEETTEGFSDFSAAMLGSSLQGQGARDVFEGVSVATIAMHLNAQRAQQVFLALGQMMSKGTVQAQEMKLQLGNALPGSFQIAARAMKMTTGQLTKFMEDSKLMASDFLPKFAAELKKTFSGAVPNAVKSLSAEATDLNNQIIQLKLNIGKDLEPLFLRILKLLDAGVKKAGELWGQFKNVWAQTKDSSVVDGLIGYFGMIKGQLLGIWENIREPLLKLFDAITEWREPILGLLSAMGQAFSFILGIIGQLLPHTINIVTWVIKLLKNIYDILEKLQFFSAMYKLFQAIGEGIKAIGDVIQWVYEHQIKPIVEAVEALVSGTKELLGVTDDIKNGLPTPTPKDIQSLVFGTTKPVNQMVWAKESVSNGARNSAPSPAPDLGKTTGTKGAAGQKILNITINIQKLVDKFEVITTQIQGIGEGRIKDLVTQTLLSAVNDSQIVPER